LAQILAAADPRQVRFVGISFTHPMRIFKVFLGLGCLLAAVPLGLFAWESLVCGELWFKLVPALCLLGLVSIGLFLISRRNSVLSARTKVLIAIFFSFLVVSPALLDMQIRHERKVLQSRAKSFLLIPVPMALSPDSNGYMGYEYEGTNDEADVRVFGHSRTLIQRYATSGRIRWSARIQGQFASTSEELWFPGAGDIQKTNQEVRAYMAERNDILGKEWRMGFWQWIEDSIEMKDKIPEFEEEEQYNGWIDELGGTWTNENFETMTISNNGIFSARWVSPVGTNIFKGTELFVGAASVLRVIRDRQSVFLQDGDKKDIRILHVDGHNLIYELDGQTNSMKR
jgi:hypothetical protein